MSNPTALRRPAFTLIELLVVIAIITVITAAAVGVFTRVRAGQARSNTDATLNKINALLDRQVKAINAQIDDDVRKNHPGYAAVLNPPFGVGNPDLAKAIWTHAKMKNELPMSLAEATNSVQININSNVVWNLPAKRIFVALPAEPTPFDESASCLYAAVTGNAGGGTTTDTDGVEQQTGLTGGGSKCFKDAWGTPIVFVRTAYNTEVNSAPFVPAGRAAFDPFDPRGKLVTPTGVWTATSLSTWWNTQRAGAPAFSQLPPSYFAPPQNHTHTAISAGPNKDFGSDVYGLANVPPAPNDLHKDNQLSYRLRREGARGD